MTEPIYAVSAWQRDAAGRHAKQCSMTGEWCFLCEHEDDGEGNEVHELKSQIKILARAGKELPTIVRAVKEEYDQNLKHRTISKHPITNAIIKHPEWTTSSIETHLVYARFAPEIFRNVLDDQFKSQIMLLASKMVDSTTGDIVEETRKQWADTVKSYYKWHELASIKF